MELVRHRWYRKGGEPLYTERTYERHTVTETNGNFCILNVSNYIFQNISLPSGREERT